MKKQLRKVVFLAVLLATQIHAATPTYPTAPAPLVVLLTTDSLIVKCDAISTNQPSYVVAYVDAQDTMQVPGTSIGNFNGATEQTACAAPSQGKRLVSSLFICNTDTASRNITVYAARSSNRYEILKTYALASNATINISGGGIISSTPLALPVSLTNGGTNAALAASNGGVVYSNASAFAVLGGTATANKIFYSGASSAPAWSLPTFPVTASASNLKWMRSDGTNWIASTTTLYDTPTTGDLVFASTGGTLGGLPAVAVGNALISGGVGAQPSWGTVPIAAGGTNSTTALGGNRPVITSGTKILESTGYLKKTAAYTINTTSDCESIIDVDTTAGGANAAVSVTLPAASVGLGYRVTVINSGTVASGTAVNAVSILLNGSDTIDGTAVTHKLNAQYSKMTLRSTGVAGAGTGAGWIVESASDWVSSGAVGVTNFTTTAVNQSFATIALTPGEWDISVIGGYYPNNGVVTGFAYLGVGVALSFLGSTGDGSMGIQCQSVTSIVSITIPSYRVVVTANTTYQLLGLANWTGTAPQLYTGRISARRVR